MDHPSYHHLAEAYDQLFPLDPEALSLVVASLGSVPRSVVDAGCGTGLLVRALADRGIRAHGFDLDPDLLAQAQRRTGNGASYSPGDLRSFVLPQDLGPVGLVCCLGNTLPHLTRGTDLERFFRLAAASLGSGGRLLLQTLDYSFLKREQILTLPRKQVGPWTFERWYTVQASGLWTFHTRLEGTSGTRESAFELCPWELQDLEMGLSRAGFAVEGVWGGFELCPPGNTLPLVLRARVL